MSQTILRLPTVTAESGYSRSTLYLRIGQGLWPKPVKIGQRAVGWPAREVAAINAARIAGQSEESIRSLVTSLHTERKAGQRTDGDSNGRVGSAGAA
jgi:prophage regulatory protein